MILALQQKKKIVAQQAASKKGMALKYDYIKTVGLCQTQKRSTIFTII
jgi:hypothetical protein